MKSKTTAVLTVLLSVFLFSHAEAEGPKWNNHQAPFNFMFNNHIDTHQQTMEMPNGELLGYLYVEFTGEYTVDGIPLARHADCTDPSSHCSVGWQWRGVLVPNEKHEAKFVYFAMGDHPLWQINRDEIEQPGAYSHFHWFNDPDEVNPPEDPSALVEGEMYSGYLLELTAKDTFAFQHGDDIIVVHPGTDIATHLNIVPVFP